MDPHLLSSPVPSRPLSPRPASARPRPAASRPASASTQRPLSARLDPHHVEHAVTSGLGGLAGALVSSARELDPRLPGELRYPEAAVIRMAPGARLLPCKSSSCCWRWAACKLIDECQSASGHAVYFRRVLEEELGDSVLQKLINLEQEYSALEASHQELLREFQAERGACRILEEEKENLRLAAEEARHNKERAVSKHMAAQSEVLKLQARCRQHEEDLEQLRELTPEALQAKLEEKEEQLAKVMGDAEEKEAKMSSDIKDLKGELLGLRLQLKQLEALESKLVKKRRARGTIKTK
eukprot:TRINITY_DN72670_c0_g1_i1.p1 TRINITY_DN72670_c0_g1~~TRINITY_DN72670_c0_g1_i1.p1  ORF type:complete len:306 (+),score=79.67 TRINITY_DN72670_c0_g1_i1:28-918(+)